MMNKLKSKNPKFIATLLVGAALGYFTNKVIPESKDTYENYEKPEQTISYKRAKELQIEYISTRSEILNKILTENGTVEKYDVIDVSYSLDVIKQYIAYVEKVAANNGIKEGLGLRVHLGAYPKNDKNSHHPGYSTMFFIPTYTKLPKHKSSSFFTFQNRSTQTVQVLKEARALNLGNGGSPPNIL